MSMKYGCFTDESFHWQKATYSVLGLPSSVLDYQDFQITVIGLKEFHCTSQDSV